MAVLPFGHRQICSGKGQRSELSDQTLRAKPLPSIGAPDIQMFTLSNIPEAPAHPSNMFSVAWF
jgi:hypothetical protein